MTRMRRVTATWRSAVVVGRRSRVVCGGRETLPLGPHSDAGGREERDRLAALHRYCILDTPPDPAFDDLTNLAAEICETPIALISLLDAERQWFKSRVGMTTSATPRDVSFCTHAIRQPDLMVVPDALRDERFRTNPLVTAAPQIRFYAGAPLVTPDGHALGTLCVIDYVPRELTTEQRAALRALSRQVVAQLELRRRLAEIAEAVTDLTRIEAAANALVQLGHDVVGLDDLAQAGGRIVSTVLRLFRARRCLLYELDATQGALVCVAMAGEMSVGGWIGRTLRVGEGITGRALAERRPLWSANIFTDPGVTLPQWVWDHAREGDFGAVVGVPLISGDQVIGVLTVGDTAGRTFSAQEVRLLTAFADQAALAVENARLAERARTRAEKLATLSTLTRLITSTQDGEKVCEAVVQAASVLLGAAGARVWVDDPEAGVLRPQAAFNLDPRVEAFDVPAIPYGQGIAGCVFVAGAPEYVADIGQDSRWLNPRVVTEGGYHGFAGLPLIAGDRVLGVLALLFQDLRSFTTEEKELMGLLADHAAIALRNAETFAQEQAARVRAEAASQRFEHLARLAHTVTSSLELPAVLEKVARAATDLLADSAARIWVLEGDRLVLRAEAGTPGPSGSGRKTELALGEGLVGYAATTRQFFVVDDVVADPRTVNVDWMRQAGYVSLVSVPLIVHDALVGVLVLLTPARQHLPAEELELLRSFGAQAAIALENARLYDQLRAALQQVMASQEQLIQTERLRALGAMAAGVAHDFNNLLAIVLGRAQHLLRRAQDPDLVRGLEAIDRAAADGAQTVRRIQEFTRTRQTRAFARVDLREVLDGLVELTRPRWKDEALSLGVVYEVGVEGGLAPLVAGIAEELREVFLNLLTNALDAMPAGGRCVFHLAVEGRWVMVRVEDTGSGMSEETRRRAFEPFFTTKGPRGSGLGLALAWGVVTRHGGTVDIASTRGAGTTVTVRLPVSDALPAEEVSDATPPARHNARVLVIDDEPNVRSVLRDLLDAEGYIVLEAGDGAEGLTRCETEGVDLVVTDLSMPGMSGWDVSTACKERFPGLPVGLVTGWGDQLDPARIQQSRIQFVLAKPFVVRDVLGEIARALRSA